MRHCLVALIVCAGLAHAQAEVIVSCDRAVSARIEKSGVLVFERDGGTTAAAKIDHDIVGGAFSVDKAMLAVYGVPNKIDAKYPQAMRLSLYALERRARRVMRRMYGAAVYEVAFDLEPSRLVVNSRFGIDVIDVKTKKVESFDASSNLQPPVQHCGEPQ